MVAVTPIHETTMPDEDQENTQIDGPKKRPFGDNCKGHHHLHRERTEG
jgi:hypothetical protein